MGSWLLTDDMVLKLNMILSYALFAFVISTVFYPSYIRFLTRQRAGKTIREKDVTGSESSIFTALHAHKAWTPTMGGWFFLIIVALMVGLSFIPYKLGWINNTLVSRRETYILLFWFFSMGCIGLLDDILNIRWYGAVKWLSARSKTIGMIIFAAFISYRFYWPLWVDFITLWPGKVLSLGWLFLPFSFLFVLFVTHAINITDGLDGLAWGMMTIVFATLTLVTFLNQTYISTALLVVISAVLLSFLRYNISPAKIFMGDSWAFSLGGLLSSLVLMLNMRVGIFIPFVVLFLLFIVELLSSFLQIIRKKYRKKKLFAIAPLHHLREFRGMKEHSIVMKFWMIQWILALLAIILILYVFIL